MSPCLVVLKLGAWGAIFAKFCLRTFSPYYLQNLTRPDDAFGYLCLNGYLFPAIPAIWIYYARYLGCADDWPDRIIICNFIVPSERSSNLSAVSLKASKICASYYTAADIFNDCLILKAWCFSTLLLNYRQTIRIIKEQTI
jgi:hypothetical protein